MRISLLSRALPGAPACAAILLATFAMPASLHAQHAPPAGWDAFTRAFDAHADTDRVVGASALVMRDGRVLAHHEHGDADRALGQRVNERTIFHWGSITKTLTAIAIMQLRDRGRLSLDDQVTRYVPELRLVHDAHGSMDSITIRMLLSHSAGFQNPTWPYTQGKPWQPFEPTTWAQLVAMMPYQEIAFAPGSRFSYSNPGFIYLARIIEQLTGDPWESYVQKNIFAPLGLTRSYFRATPYFMAEDRSNNYTVKRDAAGRDTVVANGREFDPGITVPNGGWNAPLADLATYLAFLTHATHGDPALARRYDTVLPRASLEEMWRPLHPTTTSTAAPESMGLSFFILRRDGVTFVGHTGSQAGFVAFVYLNPATSAAVIAAFNTNSEAHPEGAGFLAIREAALAVIK